MYQTGDKVVYGMHGVCLVADLEEREVDHKQVIYLVLEPLGQQGSRYMVPTHNVAAMAKVKPMLNRDALESLLESDTIRKDAWIPEESQRKQCYRELITGGDRQKLVQMVTSLYRHRRTQNAAGKKIHICDDNFLRDAEKQLAGEISVVLDMESTEALQYLRRKLKEAD